MEKIISRMLYQRKTIVILGVGILYGLFGFIMSCNNDTSQKEQVKNSQQRQIKKLTARDSTESKLAFLQSYRVFMHPRCMNCHPAGDVPFQGDDSHLHIPMVQRGTEGKGLFALKCKNCHQDANYNRPNMPPGSPSWSMPPASHKMVFEGMSPRQLAQHFKDNHFTGFKDFEKDMIHHVEHEPLVLHSFIPLPERSALPLTHAEFVAKVKEWIDKGAVVPD